MHSVLYVMEFLEEELYKQDDGTLCTKKLVMSPLFCRLQHYQGFDGLLDYRSTIQ